MHPPEAETSCSSSSSSHSPSFNSYFNANLAETAARVSDEFVELQSPPDSLSPTTDIPGTADENRESVNRNDEDCLGRELIESHNIRNSNDSNNTKAGDCVNDDEDIEFEFDLTNLVPAGGEISLIYPVFNRDLLRGGYDQLDSSSRPSNSEEKSSSVSQIQPLLKDLFLEEDRDADTLPRSLSSSSSSSDSEVEELESIPPGTYCVWAAAKPPSPSLCTKSSSTGSASASSSSLAVAAKSKAWKLKDLLRRSKSDGKEGVMLITRKQKKKEEEVTVETGRKSGAVGGRVGRDVTGKGKGAAAREGHDYYYYYYHGKKGGEGAISNNGGNNASYSNNNNNNNNASNVRRKSYLPYKRDLVGFFVGPQGIRKMHLPPFS